MSATTPVQFKPCITIPIYNHKDTIGSVLARLKGLGLPCIIVNDGSNAETHAELERIGRREHSWVRVVHRKQNGGKGAAVQDGLLEAHNSGFTHALQIDADGQHDPHDAPRLLDLARQHPEALVLGSPQYDESIPKARLYGRQITRFWVCIETLSLNVVDTMCGFRVYPLASVVGKLLGKRRLGERMNFDIEIIVRLHWLGLQFKSVPTRVVYPEDGISHFRGLLDNVLISTTHTRLVFGMLVRLPLILWRKIRQ